MKKVLTSTQTTGDPFEVNTPDFCIAVILASGTLSDNMFLEYAVRWIDGEEVADANLVWNRRHSDKFQLDGASTSGGTIKLFDNIDGAIYRMNCTTAGAEAVLGQVF